MSKNQIASINIDAADTAVVDAINVNSLKNYTLTYTVTMRIENSRTPKNFNRNKTTHKSF